MDCTQYGLNYNYRFYRFNGFFNSSNINNIKHKSVYYVRYMCYTYRAQGMDMLKHYFFSCSMYHAL